jgi:Cu(I)-responsive transcriptional regulator
MRIGTVAMQSGVNVQTLRFYERQGLVAPPERSTGGYREYEPDTVQVVRFIRRAKELGFSLAEIRGLLDLRAMERPDRARVLALTSTKVADLDRRIAALQSLRRTLATLADTCRCTSREVRCPILDALEVPEAVS